MIHTKLPNNVSAPEVWRPAIRSLVHKINACHSFRITSSSPWICLFLHTQQPRTPSLLTLETSPPGPPQLLLQPFPTRTPCPVGLLADRPLVTQTTVAPLFLTQIERAWCSWKAKEKIYNSPKIPSWESLRVDDNRSPKFDLPAAYPERWSLLWKWIASASQVGIKSLKMRWKANHYI